MSESSRYQNALRYGPGRSIGQYPDSRDITQLPIVPVGSRTPIRYQPSVRQVATTDPVLLAAPPEQTYEMAPYLPQEPFVPPQAQTAGDVAAGGTDFMGLVTRYGPRIANELWKRLRGQDDGLGVLQNPGGLPSVPWGGDQFGYVPQGAHPFGDGGVYWAPQGLPDFNGAIVPGPAAAANSGWGAGGFNYNPDVMGGGAYMMPGGSEGMWDGAVVPKTDVAPAATGGGGTDAASGGLGGITNSIRDALGTGAAAGAMSGQLTGAFGSMADLAGGGLSAIGGWLGSNAAMAAHQNNGSPENVQYGSAIGAAIGSVIIPYVGAFPGAYLGGMIGGSINPQMDHDSAFTQFEVNPDGGFDASGIRRNKGPQEVADGLTQQAQAYWADLAAQRGYTPNAAMMNQGFRFGVGQGDNMLGGWFLQPFAGDPNMADVRPDMWGLTVQDPVMRQQVAADVAANYRPGDNFFFAGADNAGQRGTEFTRAPASMQEALDLGFQRLVDYGYYAPPGGPSPQDVQANIAAQQAYAAANPQQMWVDGDSGGWVPMPTYDNITYQAGWQAPTGAPAGLMPGDPGWTASIAMPGEASWIDPGQSNG